jgi:glycosyltransferase involved in cell wall biosynthesis
MIQTITKPQVWNSSSSLHRMDFERKPLLNEISFVIPTLGRSILEQCLYWILRGSRWPACLIVVEQGANADIAGWLERVRHIGVPVRHILSTQRGRSAGINRGLEQTRTRFVAITDDDCFVEESWLSSMATKLQQHPQAVITGRVEAAGQDMVVEVTSLTPSVQNRPRLSFDSMSGGNMGASLDIFRKVGLFEEDPAMATAEDAEWAYRALRKGVSIRYEPDVVLEHFGWRDSGQRLEQYRHYALSHGAFYGKYLRRGDVFVVARATVHFGRALRRWIRGTVARNPEMAMLGRAYCVDLLPGIWAGMHSRMRAGQLDDGDDR